MNYHLSFDFSFTENIFSGKYFALEGIDGSGKTTQAEKLVAYLRGLGKNVLLTKEPTASEIGMLIKKILHQQIPIPPMSLQYLFAADRGVHMETEVIPALKKGTVVISDRSFWSSAAYGIADVISSQALTRQDKERLLTAYNILSTYHGFLVPDKTFVISLSAPVAMQRIQNRHSEQTLYEQQEKLRKVQEEYVWLAEKFPEYLTLIDGTKSVEEVFSEIVHFL